MLELAASFALAALWNLAAPLAAGWPLIRRLRRAAELHWTERARRSWPLRRHYAFSTAIPTGACLGLAFVSIHKGSCETPGSRELLAAALGFLAGGAIRNRLAMRLNPPEIASRPRFAALACARAPWLLVLAGALMQSGEFDPLFFLILGTFLVAMATLTLGWHLPWLEKTGVIEPGRPALAAACREAAAGHPPPRSWEIDDATANAFALPFQRAVLATKPLLETLDAPQLAAICRHEIAHLLEPLRVHLPKLLVPLFMAAIMTLPTWRAQAGADAMPGIFIGGAVAFVVLGRILAAGGRKREVAADQAAVESGGDPAVYAAALETIYRVNRIPAVLGRGNRTHPDLYDRMVAAGVPPAYPRPAPPPKPLQIVATLLAVVPPVFLMVAVMAASRDRAVAEAPGTPNLLVIVGDGVGFGDLHCYGGVSIATPALDSLAGDGIRFTQFTGTGPGAAAAQFALLTGRVAARSGMGGKPPEAGTSGWQAAEWTLAEMLGRRGYQTAFVGEWLLGDGAGSHPNDQGFELFHGLPFTHAAAPPLVENRDVLDAGPAAAAVLPALVERAAAFLAAAPAPFALVFQPPPLAAAGNSPGGPHGNRLVALDQAAGCLLAALDKRGAADDTLVVFLGIGGAPRSAGGGSNGLLRDGAGTTWEGGLRGPLLARWPGTIPAGSNNLSLVWLPDLMPTLAALTGGGLASGHPLDGSPRLAALTGAQTRPAGHETVFGYRHHAGRWQIASVRQGKWKSHLAITNIDPENTNPAGGGQLYDLHVDAEERINRAASQPALLAGLAAIAAAAEATLPAAGTSDLPPAGDPAGSGVSTPVASDGSTSIRHPRIRPDAPPEDDNRIDRP
jgi:arylsulfatase A-like enzyme/Zn-dependent protease with chaperone function